VSRYVALRAQHPHAAADHHEVYFDDETCRLETDNPFDPKVLPMSPE